MIPMGFRRKSNDLFESVYKEFTILIYILSCHSCHLYRRIMVALYSCLAIGILDGC